MNIITLLVMVLLFFVGLNTLSETYPNYYRNIAIFIFVYVFLLKVNEEFMSYINKKNPDAVSDNQPSSVLKVLIKINEAKTGMHVATCWGVISLISAWNLLLLGSDWSAMMFLILGVIPLGVESS